MSKTVVRQMIERGSRAREPSRLGNSRDLRVLDRSPRVSIQLKPACTSVNPMTMAQTSREDSGHANEGRNEIFSGLKFWVAQRVPQRLRFIDDIKVQVSPDRQSPFLQLISA